MPTIKNYLIIQYGIISKSGYINPLYFFPTKDDAYLFCCGVNTLQDNQFGWTPVRIVGPSGTDGSYKWN